MTTGTVHWFNDSKCFGYITPTGGSDNIIYHHHSFLPEVSIATVSGLTVTFDADLHVPDGPGAINLIEF